MIKGEFADNEPCGCGSGEEYMNCCKGSWIRFTKDARGRVSQTILFSEKALDAREQARKEFKRIFGRSWKARDRTLSLGLRYSKSDYRRQFLETSRQAGVPKYLVYATDKTGLWVSNENYAHLSPRDRAEWDEAIEEYFLAESEGVDLLDRPETPTNFALSRCRETLDDFVTHLGSYLDRNPRKTRKDWRLFCQYMLLIKIFWNVKSISDRWETITGVEICALARGVYEASLLIGRARVDSYFAETLKAQALSGTKFYPYRKKKDGSTDYSKVVDVSTNKIVNIRTSYRESASTLGESHAQFFDVLYPLLSNQIHFNSLDMIQRIKSGGCFLVFDDGDERTTAMLAFICGLYAASGLLFVEGIQAQVKCDIAFIGHRLALGLENLIHAFMDENIGNENLELVIDALAEVSWELR